MALRGFATALLLFLATTGADAQPRAFDFYVLSLSWSPSYCEAEGNRRSRDEQCSRARPFAFVVHGLWPQYERGFPRACVTPAPWVPEATIRSTLELMPARALILHQWREHGTCSGLSAEAYFDLMQRARSRVRIPDRFHKLDAAINISPPEVEDAFLTVNPSLQPGMISVTCDDRRLREVRICMSKELEFRPCPEIDRRACRSPRVTMPPVRGG
jgi:ribonuclease T2